ncbi:MAG: heavy-metal-associated domain-containing protein [Bacteroidota bacterium]|nr:heavy-metal-associated domain-containing protein [Bacteroidota bacterium]MDX5431770.1 heavy-metal-associated domain-containing protein [Bacteroidota bacterium]MDX5470483.1 heavy-metal-associated domain-containing protein [Bacteroidota bacterium]
MKHTLIVRGMHCGHCVASVREVFERQDGIRNFELSLETGLATFESDSEPNLQGIQEELLKQGNYTLELPHHENN